MTEERLEITLFSDASENSNRFGITDEKGGELWHGQFFGVVPSHQAQAELEAAKKAVWLASQIGARVGRPVSLTLKVDAEWLVWANHVGKEGGKAKKLSFAAEKSGVDLFVEHISGKENPADKWTKCKGFRKAQEAIDLWIGRFLAD